MTLLKPGTVSRISFGTIISPQLTRHEDHVEGYVLGLGKRPRAAKGGLSLVKSEDPMEDGIYRQLETALPALRKNALSDESPYAEKDGLVAAFAKELFSGIKDDDLMGMIDRLIDNRPYISPQAEMMFPRTPTLSPPFRFDPEFLIPDVLPSAGEIFAQVNRTVADEATGGSFFILTHPMEPYILSVAALRMRGVNAYPANAVLPAEQGEIYHPLITIVDLTKDIPLMTFDLMAVHPPMGSVDILSDVAVKAITFTMLAQARIMHLTAEMFVQNQQGRELSMDELLNQLNRVADPLFEAHKRWPGCHFISNALALAFQDVADVLTGMQMSEARANMEDIVAQNPQFAIPGVLQQHIESQAAESATSFVNHIKHELALKIAKSS